MTLDNDIDAVTSCANTAVCSRSNKTLDKLLLRRPKLQAAYEEAIRQQDIEWPNLVSDEERRASEARLTKKFNAFRDLDDRIFSAKVRSAADLMIKAKIIRLRYGEAGEFSFFEDGVERFVEDVIEFLSKGEARS